MITYIKNRRTRLTYRLLSAVICFAFTASTIMIPVRGQAQTVSTVLNLPVPGTLMPMTEGFTPVLIHGLTIHPDNPLEFDFIVGTGDTDLEGDPLKDEADKLIKYFLAALTVPEEEIWVNLSPYEKDRIIPEGLGDTEMGRDLLAQDYLLKQLSSSLMYPENELGEEFWSRVHEKAYEKYGTTDIPMNTFNKIWIVPEKATVYEQEETAYVIESGLDVMLEEDFVALQKNLGKESYGLDSLTVNEVEVVSGVSSEVIRDVLLPEIKKEINEGETFANLRQIYNSMILATWYKSTLKESFLGEVYVDKNKTKGVDTQDKKINQKIYTQYVESFKKGVYDYIKEDYDLATEQIIPRKYFSGGLNAQMSADGSMMSEWIQKYIIKPAKVVGGVIVGGFTIGGILVGASQASEAEKALNKFKEDVSVQNVYLASAGMIGTDTVISKLSEGDKKKNLTQFKKKGSDGSSGNLEGVKKVIEDFFHSGGTPADYETAVQKMRNFNKEKTVAKLITFIKNPQELLYQFPNISPDRVLAFSMAFLGEITGPEDANVADVILEKTDDPLMKSIVFKILGVRTADVVRRQLEVLSDEKEYIETRKQFAHNLAKSNSEDIFRDLFIIWRDTKIFELRQELGGILPEMGKNHIKFLREALTQSQDKQTRLRVLTLLKQIDPENAEINNIAEKEVKLLKESLRLDSIGSLEELIFPVEIIGVLGKVSDVESVMKNLNVALKWRDKDNIPCSNGSCDNLYSTTLSSLKKIILSADSKISTSLIENIFQVLSKQRASTENYRFFNPKVQLTHVLIILGKKYPKIINDNLKSKNADIRTTANFVSEKIFLSRKQNDETDRLWDIVFTSINKDEQHKAIEALYKLVKPREIVKKIIKGLESNDARVQYATIKAVEYINRRRQFDKFYLEGEGDLESEHITDYIYVHLYRDLTEDLMKGLRNIVSNRNNDKFNRFTAIRVLISKNRYGLTGAYSRAKTLELFNTLLKEQKFEDDSGVSLSRVIFYNLEIFLGEMKKYDGFYFNRKIDQEIFLEALKILTNLNPEFIKKEFKDILSLIGSTVTDLMKDSLKLRNENKLFFDDEFMVSVFNTLKEVFSQLGENLDDFWFSSSIDDLFDIEDMLFENTPLHLAWETMAELFLKNKFSVKLREDMDSILSILNEGQSFNGGFEVEALRRVLKMTRDSDSRHFNTTHTIMLLKELEKVVPSNDNKTYAVLYWLFQSTDSFEDYRQALYVLSKIHTLRASKEFINKVIEIPHKFEDKESAKELVDEVVLFVLDRLGSGEFYTYDNDKWRSWYAGWSEVLEDDSIPFFKENLTHAKWTVRAKSMVELINLSEYDEQLETAITKELPNLGKILKSGKWYERRSSADIMGELKHPAGIDYLIQVWEELNTQEVIQEDIGLTDNIIISLRKIGSRKAIDSLWHIARTAINSRDRINALVQLSKPDKSHLFQWASGVLENPNSDDYYLAMEAIPNLIQNYFESYATPNDGKYPEGEKGVLLWNTYKQEMIDLFKKMDPNDLEYERRKPILNSLIDTAYHGYLNSNKKEIIFEIVSHNVDILAQFLRRSISSSKFSYVRDVFFRLLPELTAEKIDGMHRLNTALNEQILILKKIRMDVFLQAPYEDAYDGRGEHKLDIIDHLIKILEEIVQKTEMGVLKINNIDSPKAALSSKNQNSSIQPFNRESNVSPQKLFNQIMQVVRKINLGVDDPFVYIGMLSELNSLMERFNIDTLPEAPIDVVIAVLQHSNDMTKQIAAIKQLEKYYDNPQVLEALLWSAGEELPAEVGSHLMTALRSTATYYNQDSEEKDRISNVLVKNFGVTADVAMKTKIKKEVSSADGTGGINLDSAMLNMTIKRDGNGVPLPVKMQPVGFEKNFTGLAPVIYKMHLINGPLILGFGEDVEDVKDFSHHFSTFQPIERRKISYIKKFAKHAKSELFI